jgi:dTDP-4-amino-4,6-dideoxygalactose transaminase
MTKIISVSLSPNTEKDDIALAWGFVFKPWRWKKGKYIPKLENRFGEMFNLSNCLSFNSGRSCLLAALGAIGLEGGDEVFYLQCRGQSDLAIRSNAGLRGYRR